MFHAFSLQAVKAYEGAEGVMFVALPKRLKNLQKKAAAEEAHASQFKQQKGWPRGYEFGSHRVNRKFRQSDWEHAMSEWRKEGGEGGGKLAF